MKVDSDSCDQEALKQSDKKEPRGPRDIWKSHLTDKKRFLDGHLIIYFNTHRGISQSEENKCMWIHSKDGATGIVSESSIL